MKTFRVVLGITVLAVTVALGARGTLNHFGVHAAVTPDLATFGSISDLPANPGVVYEAPLAESAIKLSTVSARQAIDVAENEFGLADGQIDPTARVVPVIVSVGGTPYMPLAAAVIVVL